jgi:Flp pilus assembly protein TadD
MLIDANGRQMLTDGRHADAVRHFNRLAATQPENPAHTLGLSLALGALGRFSEAEIALEHAQSLAPDSFDLLAMRANLYEQMGDEAAAMQSYLDLLAKKPDHLPAAHNLGCQLYRLGYFAEAIEQHRETLRRHPYSAATCRDLGQAQVAAGALDEGIDTLRHALQLAPQDHDTRFALGLALLRAERWAEGWPLYEARWRPGEAPPGIAGVASWQGEALRGKHLVVFAEQGFGDTVMFCRYLPLLADLAGQVSVIAPAPLVNLLQSSFPATHVDSRPSVAPAPDFTVCMGSLPLRFLDFGLATPPRPGRYLTPSSAARHQAAEYLGENPTNSLGLTWRGQSRYSGNRQRSVELAVLRTASPRPAMPHYAFQPDITPAETDLLTQQGDLDLSPYLSNFDQSAALLERLGGMLTVDTAMAHLAGGLNLPCHILHRREGEWRWGADRTGKSWYGKCFPMTSCDHQPT